MGLVNIAELRRQEIILAFYETAKNEGLENTSFAKIAKALDIQPSLIVHYFKTKDELVLALIDYCLELYLKIFDEVYFDEGHPSKRLKSLIHRLFSKDWNELFDDGVYYSSYALVYRDQSVQQKFKNLHKKLRQKLAGLLKECNEIDVIDIPNPDTVAHQIFSLVDGTYYYVNMLDNQADQKKHLKSSEKVAISLLSLRETKA